MGRRPRGRLQTLKYTCAMLRRVPWLLLLALAAALYAPTLTTGFLADDYNYLVLLGWWAQDGEVTARVLHNFGVGLDAASNFYRPLPVLSFALNHAVAGATPIGWRLVNLVAHLACGSLLAALTAGLAARQNARTALGAAIAAGVFLLSPAGPEVVAWVSGRFDALALFFMLLALACFERSERWSDRYGIAGLAAAVCAFASKESATLLPVFVLAFAVAKPRTARQASGAATNGLDAIIAAARRATPWFVLLAGYFLWRIAIFGSPFRVYPDAEPVASLLAGDWLTTLGSAAQWLEAALPVAAARRTLLVALAAALGLGGAWCLAHRAYRVRWLALVGVVALAIVLPLLQVRALDAQGEGGRLFYVAAAALALLVALPCTLPDSPEDWLWNRALRWTFVLATIAVVAAEAVLLRAALLPWVSAGAQAQQLLRELATLPARIPADGYAFVLVPDRIGSVPFGRLAQGGLALPPVQAEALLPRLVVQTEPDLPAWPENIRRGLVDALKRYPAREVWPAVAAGRATSGVAPTHYFCWDTTHARLVALSMPSTVTTTDHWLPAWRQALKDSACEALARAVPPN